MQGRLSKQQEIKFKHFQKNIETEFSKAKKLGLKSIEWTLDYKTLQKSNF